MGVLEPQPLCTQLQFSVRLQAPVSVYTALRFDPCRDILSSVPPLECQSP